MNINELMRKFPRAGKNCAITGNIPIDFFTANEAEIRVGMRLNNLRAIYRGPRLSNNLAFFSSKASMTRRCDATSVLLYNK